MVHCTLVGGDKQQLEIEMGRFEVGKGPNALILGALKSGTHSTLQK